jgi:hypothetical protein
VLCGSMYVRLSFFFWPLYCLLYLQTPRPFYDVHIIFIIEISTHGVIQDCIVICARDITVYRFSASLAWKPWEYKIELRFWDAWGTIDPTGASANVTLLARQIPLIGVPNE